MELIKEIKKVKLSTIFKNRAKQSIISQIINLKDDDDESICTSYTYEIMNNKTKEKKIETLFLILTRNMVDNLQNDNIQQYFTDITYHCIPPTVRRYKLIILSGFNLKDKKTHICAYGLIPDEKFETIKKFFFELKNNYKFNPKIITTDYSKSITKAIYENFPECLMIKCFFHWMQALWKKLKEMGYTQKNNISNTKEFIFNLKLMAFLDSKVLKKFYKLIVEEYGNKYEKFLQYFKKQWINEKKLGKYTPVWNYYSNLNNLLK